MNKMDKREYRGRITSARPAYTAAYQTKPKISSVKKLNTSPNLADFHHFSAKSSIANKGIRHKTIVPPKSGVTYVKQKGKGERREGQRLERFFPDSLAEPSQGSSNEEPQTLQPLKRSATYVIQKWIIKTEEKKEIELNKNGNQKSATISQNIENIESNNMVILKRPVSFSKLQSKIQASRKSKIPINIIYLKPYKNWTDICELTERIIAEERRMSLMSQPKHIKYEVEYDKVPTLKRSATYIIRKGKPENDNKPRDESEAEQAEKKQFDEVMKTSLKKHQTKSIDISSNETDADDEVVPKLRRSDTYTISRGYIESNLITEDKIISPHKSKIPRSIIGIGLKKMEVLKRIVTFAKQKGKIEAQWIEKKKINELYLNSVEEPIKPTRNKMDIKSQNVPILNRSRTYTKYKPKTSRN